MEQRRAMVEAGLCRWADEADGAVEMTDAGREQAQVIMEGALRVLEDSVIRERG